MFLCCLWFILLCSLIWNCCVGGVWSSGGYPFYFLAYSSCLCLFLTNSRGQRLTSCLVSYQCSGELIPITGWCHSLFPLAVVSQLSKQLSSSCLGADVFTSHQALLCLVGVKPVKFCVLMPQDSTPLISCCMMTHDVSHAGEQGYCNKSKQRHIRTYGNWKLS